MTTDTTNMPSYSIEHSNFPGCVAVAVYGLPQYSAQGFRYSEFRSVTFNERSTYNFAKPVLLRLPAYVIPTECGIPQEFNELIAQRCVVKNTTMQDLSFARFWAAYDYKVGNKARVEKKWNALSQEDRLLALSGIARQRRHSESHKTDMPYPETYIDQRRWENVFTN